MKNKSKWKSASKTMTDFLEEKESIKIPLTSDLPVSVVDILKDKQKKNMDYEQKQLNDLMSSKAWKESSLWFIIQALLEEGFDKQDINTIIDLIEEDKTIDNG